MTHITHRSAGLSAGLAAAALVVLGLQGAAFADQNPAQPTPAQAQAPTEAKATGEIVGVDAKASTVSIKTATSEMKFTYTDQTRISGGAQKSVASLTTGTLVTVEYLKEGPAMVATSIDVRPN